MKDFKGQKNTKCNIRSPTCSASNPCWLFSVSWWVLEISARETSILKYNSMAPSLWCSKRQTIQKLKIKKKKLKISSNVFFMTWLHELFKKSHTKLHSTHFRFVIVTPQEVNIDDVLLNWALMLASLACLSMSKWTFCLPCPSLIQQVDVGRKKKISPT